MTKENVCDYTKHSLAIVVIVVLVAAGFFCFSKQDIKIYNSDTPTRDTLAASGTGQYLTDPDEVTINLGVEIKDQSATKSQQDAAIIMDSVINAVNLQGISTDEISTTSYNLDVVREWEDDKYVDKGYSTIHIIQIKTSQLDKTGKIVDAAVSAGANKVNTISFGLSEEKITEAKEKALEVAATKAKDKAYSLASSVRVSLGKVVSVSQDNMWYAPYEAQSFYSDVVHSETTDTSIIPGQVSVTSTVTIVYEI